MDHDGPANLECSFNALQLSRERFTTWCQGDPDVVTFYFIDRSDFLLKGTRTSKLPAHMWKLLKTLLQAQYEKYNTVEEVEQQIMSIRQEENTQFF